MGYSSTMKMEAVRSSDYTLSIAVHIFYSVTIVKSSDLAGLVSFRVKPLYLS
jgi:hypothetical protein